MTRIVTALALALTATHAQALSCIAPSVEFSYTQAAEDDRAYVILDGQFTFDPSDLPKRSVDNNNPPDTFVKAIFSGSYFNGVDFENRWSGPVTLNAQCFGPWCSHATSGMTGLAFVERTDSGYILSLSPCGGAFFGDATDAQRAAIVACHTGGPCTSEISLD
ncbi:hypothetical protein [Shimia ponticola]|uniref:hypothetical protein n=1 Tax=Shimia ponticola TaxID=2582893 RepID=UPI0011BD63FC|nr:hypothetical protein [Shimia ponticola]